MLLYTKVAQPKVPKRRSRAGCAFCKEKKKKCDERHPRCARCEEHDRECVYEPIKPRQRRRRDPSLDLSLDTVSPYDDTTSFLPNEAEVQTPQSTCSEQQGPWIGSQLPGVGDLTHRNTGRPYYSNYELYPPGSLSCGNLHYTEPQSQAWGWRKDDMISTPSVVSSAHTMPLVHDSGPQDESNNGNEGEEDDDLVDEVPRHFDLSASSGHSFSAITPGSPSLALIAPLLPRSPILEFTAPIFNEFSWRTNRRALVDHFCNVLSHLIVFREERGNPFQQLVLPLSQSSPAVMDAMYALASAHLEFRGVENEEKSVHFHNRAIQGLARLIEQGGDVNKKELLAAIMLLVYYEVLVQQGRSNIVDGHLKGAMSILSNQFPVTTDPASAFLERAFRFYDVIAALSFGTAPLSSAPGQGCLAPFPPLDSRGVASSPGSVDSLLGMATTLWPIIHQLSNLPGLKGELDLAIEQGDISKTAVLRVEFEATTSAIDIALQEWQPVLPVDCVLAKSIDEVSLDKVAERRRLQGILNNALAYQHSALVYLYRTIYEHPRVHPLVQRHTHLSLTHCVGTVSNEGPMSALLWPLFVAACEARDLTDRELARRAFIAIDKRQGMINIERGWCIVQEVWRRADEAEVNGEDQLSEMARVMDSGKGALGRKGKQDLWRKVSEEMGVTIVLG